MNISIVISTYGDDYWRELALSRAYPSALDQGAHEIIVGHDDEGTISEVRNTLALKTSGEWLCFLDADDELASDYLKAMAIAMRRKQTPRRQRRTLFTPSVQKILRGHARQPAFYPEVSLTRGNWLVVGTVLRRDLFMYVGGFEDYPHGFEDWSLWYKCAKVGASVVKVSEAVYRQHVNPRSKHRVAWRDRRFQVATHERVQRELEAWTP